MLEEDLLREGGREEEKPADMASRHVRREPRHQN